MLYTCGTLLKHARSGGTCVLWLAMLTERALAMRLETCGLPASLLVPCCLTSPCAHQTQYGQQWPGGRVMGGWILMRRLTLLHLAL
jgi:hypothetical protein